MDDAVVRSGSWVTDMAQEPGVFNIIYSLLKREESFRWSWFHINFLVFFSN